jgi:hypothetical protein
MTSDFDYKLLWFLAPRKKEPVRGFQSVGWHRLDERETAEIACFSLIKAHLSRKLGSNVGHMNALRNRRSRRRSQLRDEPQDVSEQISGNGDDLGVFDDRRNFRSKSVWAQIEFPLPSQVHLDSLSRSKIANHSLRNPSAIFRFSLCWSNSLSLSSASINRRAIARRC